MPSENKETRILPENRKPKKDRQDGGCTECSAVHTDSDLREAFGYQEDPPSCECHDIVAQDVRAICAKEITHHVRIPGVDHLVGCRGGREITGVPTLDSCRVYCAEEWLETEGRHPCLAVHNEIGLEFVLKVESGNGPFAAGCPSPSRPVYLVVRDTLKLKCSHKDFYAFPSGEQFDRDAFREMVKFIDGSAKTIVIENCQVLDTENPCIEVELQFIDKLWKYENLMVSAMKPYPENITVTQKFNSMHEIGPCPGESCTPPEP